MPTEIRHDDELFGGKPRSKQSKYERRIKYEAEQTNLLVRLSSTDARDVSSSPRDAPSFRQACKLKAAARALPSHLATEGWKDKCKAMERENKLLWGVISELQMYLAPGVADAVIKGVTKSSPSPLANTQFDVATSHSSTSAFKSVLNKHAALSSSGSVGDAVVEQKIKSRRHFLESSRSPSPGSPLIRSMHRQKKRSYFLPEEEGSLAKLQKTDLHGQMASHSAKMAGGGTPAVRFHVPTSFPDRSPIQTKSILESPSHLVSLGLIPFSPPLLSVQQNLHLGRMGTSKPSASSPRFSPMLSKFSHDQIN
mmetsp:Transcript_8270/g.17241  ORF Transcript_8270/g.17241 Transcript_8270/m.17241 type:complete len:310 (-) Transcript_8270:232-1161(-)|eukprot:CAMPEP_0172439224 /NCGR_PEP_ID=MMETSP1065-20121228/277_1 /TAXON_ID=265537 /ORGANISM="Amphiprora paludosa, Strain CCMP125" /LENGTH=309 /DNA_ID=CAMNT_0013187873 /DNA_START=69 /DNA_END=998 /DNA_ORIENTATION=+